MSAFNVQPVCAEGTGTIYYTSYVIIIPRGLMDGNVVWKYICDSQPPYGWNVYVEFDDSGWLSGETPIGSDPYNNPSSIFVRTKVSFRDIYLRKIFRVENIPSSAILSIASDDGVEVWINGRKVLSDPDSIHGAFYWNYRLMNISDYLNVGKNSLAIRVRNAGGGACFFDSEIIFELKSLEETLFDFVYGRWNPTGGFSNDDIDETFYATSILKTLESINILDVDKVKLWITSHKFLYGDFGCWVWWQYPAIESLKNIGLELDRESAERLINVLLSWRSEDGSWGGELDPTWKAIEALASLNAIGRVNWEKTIRFIKSLQGSDGGFRNKPEDKETFLRRTFYAVRSLYLLNAIDVIDKSKTINFIMSCFKDGGFSDRPEWEE